MTRSTTSTTMDSAAHREACAAEWARLTRMALVRPVEPPETTMLRAIARAVKGAGGTVADARALAEEWERLAPELEARAARIREQVRRASCSCADGGEPGAAGRCGRCYGRTEAAR